MATTSEQSKAIYSDIPAELTTERQSVKNALQRIKDAKSNLELIPVKYDEIVKSLDHGSSKESEYIDLDTERLELIDEIDGYIEALGI